jgi:hypothetical protein
MDHAGSTGWRAPIFQDIVRAMRAKRAALKATEQPVDTSTAAGKVLPRHAGRV